MSEGKPLFDVTNPGANSPAVREELRAMGAHKFHATCVPGADPQQVERALLLSFDRMKHGAVRRVWPKPMPVFGWIADTYRIVRYRLFRAKKAEREILARIKD